MQLGTLSEPMDPRSSGSPICLKANWYYQVENLHCKYIEKTFSKKDQT